MGASGSKFKPLNRAFDVRFDFSILKLQMFSTLIRGISMTSFGTNSRQIAVLACKSSPLQAYLKDEAVEKDIIRTNLNPAASGTGGQSRSDDSTLKGSSESGSCGDDTLKRSYRSVLVGRGK